VRKLLPIIATATMILGPWFATPGVAYTGDGSNPASCASPTNLATRNVIRSSVLVGTIQLRFSDPCNTSWSRVCAKSGYIVTEFLSGERWQYPPSVGAYLTGSALGGGTNNCSGTGLTGPYSYSRAWFNDCTEAGLGACKSRAEGYVTDGAGYQGGGPASE
jgi:hypothetical protein